MTETLEQVIADEREAAQMLHTRGHTHDAQIISTLLDRVSAAAEEYLRFLYEDDAILHSGKSREWLRSQFSTWEERGHAKREGRRRYYRMLVLPRRANVSAAREAGRRAARGAA